MEIVAFINNTTKEFFLTTDHYQHHELGDEWIPVTYEFSSSPLVATIQDYINILFEGYKEILNPDPSRRQLLVLAANLRRLLMAARSNTLPIQNFKN